MKKNNLITKNSSKSVNNSKISGSLKLFLIIFFVLSLIVLVSFAWHFFAIQNPIIELSLEKYDNIVTTNDACFVSKISTENVDPKKVDFVISLNDSVITSKKIVIGSEKESNTRANELLVDDCISNSLLKEGDNFVEINTYSRNIFFNVKKQNNILLSSPSVEIVSITKKTDEKAIVKVSITNDGATKEKANILVNEVIVKESFFENGVFEETIPISEGTNKVVVFFAGAEKSISLENEISLKSNILFGLGLIALFFFVCMSFVFSKKQFNENILFSILSLFIVLSIIFFLLNYLGVLVGISLLSNISFISFFCILILSLAIIFRENFSLPKIVLPKKDYFTIFLAIVLLAIFLFNIITPTYVSFWTSFYERQSRDIYELNSVPLLDEYTHFGEKPYGYLSAYFFVDVGLSYIFGDQSSTVFAIILVLANLAFFISATRFFKKLGFSDTKSKITLALLILSGFMFGDIFFNVRHIIALALIFTSLSFFFDKKDFKAILLSGVGMFLQAPVILITSIIAFVLCKRNKIDFLKFLIGSVIVGALFYIPTFILVGLPTQAQTTTWGYLFGMPWYGVAVDLLSPILFFLIIMLPLNNFKLKLNPFSKRLLILFGILLFIQLFVSYRINIATATIFCFIGVYFVPENILEKKEVRHLLFLLFTGGLILASTVLLNYVVPDYSIGAAEYMKTNTPSDARILNEPALGHYLVLFADKKIMSDLAVEYADGNLIDQSFNFLQKKDPKIISENKIDYVFNRAMFIETQPVGSVEGKEKIEFYFLDKIYDNGVYFVHLTR